MKRRSLYPLSFRLYELVIVTEQTHAPDLSVREMSERFGAGYDHVRVTLARMEHRGIIRRLHRGIYRLPVGSPLTRSATGARA